MSNNNTFRKHKKDNFTVVDNDIFKNKGLTLKAKGLLVMMLSFPDDWEYSERGLTALSKDGRASVRSGLKELEDNGYLVRKQLRIDNRYSTVQYNVYEVSIKVVENQTSGNQTSENPTSDKQPNKELSNQVLTYQELNDVKDSVRVKKSKPHVYDETFEMFWYAYPNKTNKKGSEIKFLKLSTEEHSLIMDDIDKRKNYEGWTKDDGKYVPHPLTYLNQRRWEDEYKQTKPKVEQESVLKGVMF